jgi:hypothetical protein
MQQVEKIVTTEKEAEEEGVKNPPKVCTTLVEYPLQKKTVGKRR